MISETDKCIVLSNKDLILELKHSHKMRAFLKNNFNIEITAQELYDILYVNSLKSCEHSRFISFSVGYRACKKGCKCYCDNLSQKLTLLKGNMSADEKRAITDKRKETVRSKYNVDNVFQLDIIKEKSRATKLETYGDENYRNDEKIRQTNIYRYGCENPMQNTDIRDRYYTRFYSRDFKSIAYNGQLTKLKKYGDAHYRNVDKAKQTNITRYGTENAAASEVVKNTISKNLRAALYDKFISNYSEITPIFSKDDYINGIDNIWKCNSCNSIIHKRIINGVVPRCFSCNPRSSSIFEQEVVDYISTVTNHEIIRNDRTTIAPKELDVLIPTLNLAFECNGTYRHTEIAGGKHKKYHLQKTEDCSKLGISLMHISDVSWESDKLIIQSIINHKLGLSKRVYARKCVVKQLKSSEQKDFFNANHLQHGISCFVAYGLFFENELVAAMSFGVSRFNKSASWEMLRFCSKINIAVIGGPSRLISHFTKHHNGAIITYADKSYGESNFYDQVGFVRMPDTLPGYTYFKDGQLFSRMQFQKHKLSAKLPIFDANKSEWENMKANGYDRIWDCGHKVYIKNNS